MYNRNMKLNFGDLQTLKESWQNAKPYPHVVIDNFLPEDFAKAISQEFPSADSDFWYDYSSPLEIKKACSDWNRFPSSIYNAFLALLSPEVTEVLSYITDRQLTADIGLHGGGLHLHKAGGKLNTHLDYSIHPKTKLQRKVNIIVYVAEGWDPTWDGALGLWDHNSETNQPGNLVQKIDCLFNRAVIFDTTMDSWHGLPDPVLCPEDKSRNSLAAYFLCDPPAVVDERVKALYAPSESQKGDEAIYDLIKKRSSAEQFKEAYKVN